VALKNVRDKKQFMYLASQVYAEDSLGLHNDYLDATQEPFGYLLLDLTQTTNDGLSFRTNIFPYELTPLTVYSYVGDEACEYELSQSAGAEDSRPEIGKAIISKCNKELGNSISECVLNVLNCNIKLKGCDTHKLQKHKAALRNVFVRHVPLSSKTKLMLPLLSAVLPTLASLILRNR